MLEVSRPSSEVVSFAPEQARIAVTDDAPGLVSVSEVVTTLSRRPTLHSLYSGVSPSEPGDSVDFNEWIRTHFLNPTLAEEDFGKASAPSRALVSVIAGFPDKALQLLPSASPDFWTASIRARALVGLGKAAQAESELRQLLSEAPRAQLAHLLGRYLLSWGRAADAAAILRPWAETVDDSSFLNDFATALLVGRHVREAIPSLRRALRLQPNYGPAANNLGLCFVQLGNLAKAERYFREALSLTPGSQPVIINLAEVLIQCSRFEDALAIFKTAEHDHPAILEGMSWCWLQLDRKELALGLLRKAVQVTARRDAMLLNNLGTVLLALGRPGAEELFREAHALAPANEFVITNLARHLNSSHKYAETVALLDAIGEGRVQESVDLIQLITAALLETGANARAAELLRKATERYPQCAPFWGNLGFVLACRLDQLEASLMELKRGLDLHPNDVLIRNNLAYSLILSGRLNDARAMLQQALAAAEANLPVAPVLLATAGLLLIREGHYSRGMKLYNRAFNSAPVALRPRLEQKMLIEEARQEISAGRSLTAQKLLRQAKKLDAAPELTREADELLPSVFRH